MKIQYALMSCTADLRYLEYWPIVARAWLKLGITPVCLFIPNNPSCQLPDIPGSLVHSIPPLNDVHIVIQAQMLRYWGSHLYPESPVIVSDIDFIPLSKRFFSLGLKRYSEDAYIHLQPWQDAYFFSDIANIPEKITRLNEVRYLTAIFHVAKGRTMHKVLELSPDWAASCRKTVPYSLDKNASIMLINNPHSNYARAIPRYGDEIYTSIRLHHSKHHPIIYSPYAYKYRHMTAKMVTEFRAKADPIDARSSPLRFLLRYKKSWRRRRSYIGAHFSPLRYAQHKEIIDQLITKTQIT